MRVRMVVFYVLLFFAALLPAGVFAVWLRDQNWELKEKISAWDPFIKTMAIAGATIVGLASFERFLDQRQQQLADALVARAQTRNEAFSQAITLTSRVATAQELTGSEDIGEAVTTFWRIYWGDLARFEGESVERAMVSFGRSLRDWQETSQKPRDIQRFALDVAHACRSEIEASDTQIDAIRARYSLF
jgi:hypothetical protein